MLTPRQREIAQLVARGLTNKEIAKVTGLSRRTVEDHIAEAANRIPGDTKPRHKLIVWFTDWEDIEKAA